MNQNERIEKVVRITIEIITDGGKLRTITFCVDEDRMEEAILELNNDDFKKNAILHIPYEAFTITQGK